MTHRTRIIFAALVAMYALVVLTAHFGPASLQDVTGIATMVPMLSASLLHKLGVPGMLSHNGACGWGWCSPTVLGWIVVGVLWLGLAWLLAKGVARVTSRGRV